MISKRATTEQQPSDDRCLTKINSWRTAWRSLLTKFSADENFLLYSSILLCGLSGEIVLSKVGSFVLCRHCMLSQDKSNSNQACTIVHWKCLQVAETSIFHSIFWRGNVTIMTTWKTIPCSAAFGIALNSSFFFFFLSLTWTTGLHSFIFSWWSRSDKIWWMCCSKLSAYQWSRITLKTLFQNSWCSSVFAECQIQPSKEQICLITVLFTVLPPRVCWSTQRNPLKVDWSAGLLWRVWEALRTNCSDARYESRARSPDFGQVYILTRFPLWLLTRCSRSN